MPADHLREGLVAVLAPDSSRGRWQPHVFDLSRQEDRGDLCVLLEAGEIASGCDTISQQLHELIAIRSPWRRFSHEDLGVETAKHLDETPMGDYGRWVYYPWSRRVVHVLPEDEFREVRVSRNRHKITAEEQARLADAVIGIIGLSVGRSAATTLALEGIGGEYRLADFDVLSLSNMNRLRSETADLGVNKAVLAAREIYGIDPYARVEIFPGGIDETNMAAFLDGDGRPLDLLVEECDDLAMKVRIREMARERGTPVVMETSDRGLIDVERFDLEPRRPLFHGLVDSLDSGELQDLSNKDRVRIVMQILGGESRISSRMAASLAEIGRTIKTWPQLASAVALGGALVTEAARRILLDEFRDSGRYSVDLATIVTGPGEATAGSDGEAVGSATAAGRAPLA